MKRQLPRLALLLIGIWFNTMAIATDAEQEISQARAKSLFILQCAGCHRIDGSGQPGFGVPSMRNTLGYFVRSPEGRAFLVQVPGARNASITDAELAALTNWELLNFSKETLPSSFTPYTTKEVSQWRANPPSDVAVVRAKILHELQNMGTLPSDVYEQLIKRVP